MRLEQEVGHEAEKSHSVELSPAQRSAVVEEIDRLLDDPAFRHSKRCVTLLRWVVDRALAENPGGMKERTLGVEVFGRNANYDTNADPVVRMTANEIRKRLAQYYQKPNGYHSVRIRLVPGSYLPAFDFDNKPDVYPAQAESTDADSAIARTPAAGPIRQVHSAALFEEHSRPDLQRDPEVVQASKTAQRPASVLGRKGLWLLAILLLAAASVFALIRSDLFRSRQYQTLAPLLRSKGDLIVALSDNQTFLKAFKEGTAQGQMIDEVINSRSAPRIADPASFKPASSFGDVNVAHKIAIWLAERGKSSTLRPSSEISFVDFRHRPLVLVGSVDNPWSLILLSHLRFSPRVDPSTRTMWIQDAQSLSKRDWSRTEPQVGDPLVDYAVVSRFFDAETGEWVLGIAGLGQRGTEAACQLLLDPAYNDALPSGVGSKNNFQIVLKTAVINGKSGPPQILAFHSW